MKKRRDLERIPPLDARCDYFHDFRRAPGKVLLGMVCATALVQYSAVAATIYWDGTGPNWNNVTSWSQASNGATPDPEAIPGTGDIAAFSAYTAVGVQSVNLDGTQSVLGLTTASPSGSSGTILRGGGIDSILNIGASGINQSSGYFTIGETAGGQQVAIRLDGTQSWISTGGSGIIVNGAVSIGSSGDKKLSLGGNQSGSLVNGTILDGAGVLSLGKGGSGMWRLRGANTYSGPTTISGGILRIENDMALGSVAGGTTIQQSGVLQLSGGIAVTGESLTMSGNEQSAASLVNLDGANTWAGDIAIVPAPAHFHQMPVTRIAINSGTLRITGDVSLSPKPFDQLVLQGYSTGEISGVISGPSRLSKVDSGTWILSDANTYTGKTSISGGVLVASSLNRVVGGSASSSLGAPTTVADGTIVLGGSGSLRYVGTGETTDRAINLSNFAGRLHQEGSGLLEFAGDLTGPPTSSYQLALSGSTAGEGKISGAINGSVSIWKTGTGTWTFSAANTYTGATDIRGGTLVADLSTNSGGVLPSSTALAVEGGTLRVSGAASGKSKQSVGSLSAASLPGRIIVDPNGGEGTTLAVSSPLVKTSVFGRLIFDYSRGTTNAASIGNNIVAWNADLTNGIISPNFIVTDVGGTGFATVSDGHVVRFVPTIGLPPSGAIGTENYVLNANTSSASPGSLNLIQQANQTINTLTVETGAVSGTMSVADTVLRAQTILVNGSSSNNFTIAAGTSGGIQAVTPSGNVILEQNAAGTLTISAPILANGESALINSGTGLTILSGANTYTGITRLMSGTTRFSGRMDSKYVILENDAIAQLGSPTALTSVHTVRFGYLGHARFQLKGHSATIGGLSSVSPGSIIENDDPVPATLTITTSESSTWDGLLRDGGGGGPLSVALTPALVSTTTTFKGGLHSGRTTINGPGIVQLTSQNAGDLLVSNGGRLRFTDPGNAVADTATVTIEGVGSSFNGAAANDSPMPLNETFANLHMIGGAFTTGAGTTGLRVTGETTIAGGPGNTVFFGSSGGQYVTNRLSLTDMTGLPTLPNNFTINGYDATYRSRLAVGSGGLHLNNSILSLGQGGLGAKGSLLVLDGDVTTSGTLPSRIYLDSSKGTNGAVSLRLSSSPGSVDRTFNIGGSGADLSIHVPVVNGEATLASITKTGPGSLTLSATNTYNDATNIQEGSLVISGSASGSTVKVGDTNNPEVSAIFRGGPGVISPIPTVSEIFLLTPGAVIDPGPTSGTTGIVNTVSLTLSNSARLSIQIGGAFAGGNGFHGYDLINVLSPVVSASVSGGLLELSDTTSAMLPADSLLFLVVNQGIGAPSLLFSGVTLGGVPVSSLDHIVIGGRPFALVNNANYDGSTGPYGGMPTGGNDIALVAIPEPMAIVSVFTGIVILASRRSRRPRSVLYGLSTTAVQ